jgi:DNA repair protein RecO (recombination protein O)
LESRLTKIDGIVLTSTSFGEGHKIVRVLTQRRGKIEASAFGVRKTKSRFGSKLEPFSHIRLLLYRKSEESLYTVRDADVIHHNQDIREDLDKFLVGSAVIEPIVRFVESESEERELFELLATCLKILNEIPKERAIYLLCMYEIKFISAMGYRQQTVTCTICGSQLLSNETYADSRRGFPLCSSCRTTLSVRVKPSALKFMGWAQQTPLARAEKVAMKEETLRSVRELIEQLYQNLFHRGMSSWEQLENTGQVR